MGPEIIVTVLETTAARIEALCHTSHLLLQTVPIAGECRSKCVVDLSARARSFQCEPHRNQC